MNRAAIETVAKILRGSEASIAFTGSGISAESGVPTFRGRDGLWRRFRAEDLATPQAFERNPSLVWEWYAWRARLVLSAKPNKAHRLLAEMERSGLLYAVVTQNVDGLHQRAGSRRVVELHGSLLRARCTSCGLKTGIEDALSRGLPPRCAGCGGLLRPDVVWFGEPLDYSVLEEAFSLARLADVVIVIGTSGAVDPAGMIPLVALDGGAKIINVNLEPNRYSGIAHVDLRMGAVEFAEAISGLLGLEL